MRGSNGLRRSLQAVDAERRGDVGRARQPLGAGERQAEQRRGRLGAVDQGQTLLRRASVQPARSTARAPARAGRPTRALAPALAVPRFAFADQHQREVRQRRQVAARPDRSARRHDGMHTAIDQRDQQLERLDPNAGKAFRQHVRAQRHRRADDGHRQRIADAGGVAAQQIDLQLGERVVRESGRRRSCRSRC